MTLPEVSAKLSVLVRLDVDTGAAHIRVGGNVTDRNLGAVFGVARRASTVTGGAAVVLDLSRARVDAVPLKNLQMACSTGELPPANGSPAVPCRLAVMEPAAA